MSDFTDLMRSIIINLIANLVLLHSTMTSVIKATDLQDLLAQEALQNGESRSCQKDSERVLKIPQKYGKGSDCSIQLRPELTVGVLDIELRQSWRVERVHESRFPLISKFYLSGCFRVLTPGIPVIQEEYVECSGHNYLYYLPDLIEFEECPMEESLQQVYLRIDLDYLRMFGQGVEDWPQPLQQLIEREAPQRFHQSLGMTTSEMQQVLNQILHCPYRGVMRQIYLEGKALELLSLQLTRWVENPLPRSSSPLRSDDIERVHYARDILLQDLIHPPSILDLSRQVGLNDYKLKLGFRQTFGTTVFGYLKRHRMAQAKQLLTEPSLSIAGVAHTVGYASQSRFCDAFKRQYGLTPRAYRSLQL